MAPLLPPFPDGAVLALDIGGTKTAAALVRDGVMHRLPSRPTPTGSAAAIEDAVAAAAEAARALGPAPSAVGLSVAGFVAPDRARMLLAPNLPLSGHDLGGRLADRLGVPVVLENDVNAAAWGEYRHGGHVLEPDATMVLAMVGTGLGGGIVVGGHLLRGARGAAGEIGHLELEPGGRPCGCGLTGCWEQYASGTALVLRAREALAAGRASALPPAPDGHDLLAAARAGDALAREVYADLGTALGRGLAALGVVVDPDLVVIGGGVAAASDLFRPTLEAALSARVDARLPLPRLTTSRLGGDAPLLGVAELAAVGVGAAAR